MQRSVCPLAAQPAAQIQFGWKCRPAP